MYPISVEPTLVNTHPFFCARHLAGPVVTCECWCMLSRSPLKFSTGLACLFQKELLEKPGSFLVQYDILLVINAAHRKPMEEKNGFRTNPVWTIVEKRGYDMYIYVYGPGIVGYCRARFPSFSSQQRRIWLIFPVEVWQSSAALVLLGTSQSFTCVLPRTLRKCGFTGLLSLSILILLVGFLLCRCLNP